ncbi:MAG: hypothetical protein RI894_1705, partial [Bacteroidota bacterium]
TYGTNSPIGAKIFAIMSESLKKAGIELSGIPLDGNALPKRLKEGTMEMWLSAKNSYPFQTPQSLYWKTGMELNYSRLSDNTVDSLLTAHENEPNEAKRIEILKRFQARLLALQPQIYLYTRKSLMVLNKDYELGKHSVLEPGYWTGSVKQK